MKNMDSAYRPAKRTAGVKSIGDVFRDENDPVDDPWVVSSVRMRKSVRSTLKSYACAHDVRLQDVVDQAFREFGECHA